MSVPVKFKSLVRLSLKHNELRKTLSINIKKDVLKMIEMQKEQLSALEKISVACDKDTLTKERIKKNLTKRIKLYEIHLQYAA